jgi:predicted nucleic acid-binding protein
MPLLVDTGVIFALAYRKDAWHARVRTYLESHSGPLLAPITILPEVAYLLRDRIGAHAERAFVTSLAGGEIAVEHVTHKDWKRVEQLMAAYETLGFVDASVVAIAERLKLHTIATTDRRDFTVVRPAHVERFTLVP